MDDATMAETIAAFEAEMEADREPVDELDAAARGHEATIAECNRRKADMRRTVNRHLKSLADEKKRLKEKHEADMTRCDRMDTDARADLAAFCERMDRLAAGARAALEALRT